ncbi:Transglutaminase-like enzyme, putative cysteine protease [Halovenus aranensis]|uniref:Transglutaminase-like enzyme, putative cysteine protease n=1 Tax=Halovenus aranensis TaxID=890420 RepID=A0A1G8X4U0_9EURY|nr:transglutaminaseTgpA domain-containing protein [Halovenus aranensis]SDJ85377.1 Transglutaminase-like enzyme, putative cysteine protease [Halovenus aranensis]
MPTDDTPETTRSRARIALVAGCVLTAVLAALLAPGLAAGDIAGTPIDSILPGEPFKGSGAGDGGFGALNPGDETGVGGDTGLDRDTFASNDTAVHFEVESSEPAYWRTGSYDTYTGGGWERTTESTAYEPPLSPAGLTNGTVEFDLTLEQPATAIPTVWQPRRIEGVDGLEVTDGGAIRATEAVDAGTTITGVSRSQVNDVNVLRAAGEDYPAELAERYTQLPGDTPERVERFTEELTTDDETPYDTATTIQQWLRSQKEYSLQADEQSGNIADTFIFEMEAGYCEYFATAMTTMLRSQDIPARYVVGYSTGQPVGENSYEVRGMNAHAWVEAYFPDVGWVKFDPTPGGSRLDSQSDVLEEELGEDVDLEEPGSPGETFEPGSVTQETEPDDPEDDESDGQFDISLNRTAVPGLPVSVEVTNNGEFVSDIVVTVNGERIGTTDEDGAVTFTVPDTEELRISASILDVSDDGNLTARSVSTAPLATGRLFSNAAGDALSRVQNITNGTSLPGPESNTTVAVERDASLSLAGDIRPAQNVSVSVTVGGVAIPDATVTLDGAPVGTTDASGRATVTLPDSPGNATLAAERGSISGQRTVTIPGLDLTVSTGAVPLPFAPATATVTAGDDPVAGAPVMVDGEQVATTGPDGTADIRLSIGPSATVEASRYGLTDSATVDGLLRNAALVGGGLAVVVSVPAVLVYRRDLSARRTAAAITQAAERALVATPLALLWGVRRGTALVAAVPPRLKQTAAYLRDAVRGRVSLGELKAAFVAWLATKRGRAGAVGTAAESERVDISGGIQRAWAEFLTRLSVEDPGAYTPRELAVHAVEEDGHPAEAVQALLTAFRAVEYGSQPPKAHLDRAERALDRLGEPTTQAPESVSTDGGQDGHSPETVHPGQPDGDGGTE